jgi:hypothetical protein
MAAGRRRWLGRGGGGFRRGAAESTGYGFQVRFASGRRTKETRTVETPGPQAQLEQREALLNPTLIFFTGGVSRLVAYECEPSSWGVRLMTRWWREERATIS